MPMPRIDGVCNYATRYRDMFWHGGLETFVLVENGMIINTHKHLKTLV